MKGVAGKHPADTYQPSREKIKRPLKKTLKWATQTPAFQSETQQHGSGTERKKQQPHFSLNKVWELHTMQKHVEFLVTGSKKLFNIYTRDRNY